MLDALFSQLGLSEKDLKVYLVLLDGGPKAAGTLAKVTGLPRSTLYDSLESLHRGGLIVQSERSGVKLWSAEAPETIGRIVERETESWSRLKKKFDEALPALLERQYDGFVKPRFSYFEGLEGVRNILRDMLLYRDMSTQAFWPASEMLELLGAEFFNDLNRQRIRQNLFTQAIWPEGKTVDVAKYPCFGVGEKFRREIRIAPPGIDCSMGYWAYQTKVAFVSSRKECFGFIVESPELRQMLKTQFDVLWGISRPLSVPLRQVERFLRDI